MGVWFVVFAGGARMALSCILFGALFWAAQVAILSAVDVPQTLHYYVSNYAGKILIDYILCIGLKSFLMK